MNKEDQILPESYLQQGGDKTINKLILLFLFDKMEVPLTENTILDICSSTNEWIPYMDCKPLLPELIEAGFLYEMNTTRTELLYSITTEGTTCLGHFYSRIPTSLRDIITEFVKEQRMKYKRKQEYDADYYKNDDGTYTVLLKIIDTINPVLRLEFTVPNQTIAKSVFKNWENKAAQVYSAIFEALME
ncbi:MAG: DUF4364 family protein [Clostridia bacterium]